MISVVLTVYNCERYIQQSVRSILSQTHTDFEIIIVNDGSTDQTMAKVQEINDQRIRIIDSQHIGRGPALNLAVKNSHGEIIAIQDADDISFPERLQVEYQYIKTQPMNTLVSCWYAVFSERKLLYIVRSPKEGGVIKKKLALTCHFPNAGMMFYKDFLVRHGMYRDVQYGLEDYDLFLRTKDEADFYVIPRVMLFYRSHPISLSNNNLSARNRLQYALQEQYYRNASKEFGFTDTAEETEYRGWREYFYGNKFVARKYWAKIGLSILKHPRIMIAWCVTFMPEYLFISFKESRVKFRLLYLATYFSSSARHLRSMLQSMMNDETA
ncbi:MAG: glycosyltransferase family 2 protein [Bacteroidota bacterium]